MNKYEQLIEHIINDEEDKARALFHEIVVEKSRDIYESLMDEEYAEEGMRGRKDEPVDDMIDEISADEIGEGENNDMDDMGDMDDEGPMGMGDEEGDLEQKVMDLESELEALKAEFEQLMGDEGDMDMIRIIRLLHRHNYDGVIIPDHTPQMSCPGPWYAGMAHALGYMKAVVTLVEQGS